MSVIVKWTRSRPTVMRVAMKVAALLARGSQSAMFEVSDQYSMLDHAYQSVRDALHTTTEGKLMGGDSSLNQSKVFHHIGR